MSNSSLGKTFVLGSLQHLMFRPSVSSLQRSFSLKFILGQKKICVLKKNLGPKIFLTLPARGGGLFSPSLTFLFVASKHMDMLVLNFLTFPEYQI